MGLLSKTTPENEEALNNIGNIEDTFNTMFTQKMLSIYPVGAIYMSTSSTSPASLFGGTWEQIENRFLLAAGDTYEAGRTGGEAIHTLTIEEIPSHSHQYRRKALYASEVTSSKDAYSDTSIFGNTVNSPTENCGGGAAHNNMPPYLAVYVWKRTA